MNDPIKAISLTQPWATLVAISAKEIETRSWSSPYRGWLAIHAAKGLDAVGGAEGLVEQCRQEPFRSVLLGHFGAGAIAGQALPLGAIVAVGNLHRIERTGRTPADEVYVWGQDLPITDPNELAFGDYTPGRFAWVLTNVHPLVEPVPCRGALRVWTMPPDVEEAVRNQVRL